MNAELETRRSIETWLANEIDVPVGEEVLDAARRRVAATRQHRRWLATLRTDRQAFVVMRRIGAGAGIAATIVLTVVVAGFRSEPGVGDGVTLPASATPSGEGSLASTVYTTMQFVPRVTATVPAGWRVTTDSPGAGFALEPYDLETAAQVEVCLGSFASEPDRNVPVSGVGQSSDALMEHLMGRSDYRILAGPVEMEIDGLQGSYLDVEGFSDTQELILLASGDTGSFCPRNLYGTERLRLGFLDLPDGTTISIGVHTFSGPDVIARGWQVVDSFKIDRTPMSSPTP